jgi:DNA repair protein SbcD/Mre11
VRIVHLADVHLDRPFAGLPSTVAATQRRRVMATFERALEIAREREADLLTIGGDLWEEEHVRADTRASVAHALERLGIPVLMICGNHDPLIAGGSYRRTAWPSNVTIAPLRTPHRFDFGDVAIWAVSWGGGDISARALERLEIPEDGSTHLALLHGTAPTAPFVEETTAYFPFDPAALREIGLGHVLAGHIHQASYHHGVVYPGSPEPLGWAEGGRHCAAVIDVVDGSFAVDLIDINMTRFETRELDCTDCSSSASVADRVTAVAGDAGLFLKIRLVGDIGPECEIDSTHLASLRAGDFAWMQVIDATQPMLDIEARIERKSLDGLFTRKLLQRIDTASDERERHIARLALEAGLHAVEGREMVLRVD